MATDNRPLSPHLQVYKPQLTSVLSITHRGTGVFLSLGALLLSCWLLTIATGPQSYQNLQVHLTNWYGQVALLLWAFSFFYHLANGIRHLFWDAGMGLEISTAYISGYITISVSVILTALTWYLACGTGGTS